MKSQSHLLALIFASSLVVACMAVSTAARGEVDAPLVERSVIQTLLKDSGAHGGLVVHVGCGSGEESAALAAKAEKPFVVQGLEGDREALEKARKCARELGVSGELTFKHWDGDTLPYTDNLVNVLFWEPAEKEANMDEIMRVLAPGGVAYVQQEDGWHEEVKPWPDTIDDWSHHRYNAGNVGASNDEEVGPPTHIQWEAGPRFMRSHEIETGFSSLVSAKGRIYYIIDDGPIGITDARFPSRWSLMARDAFNGVELWKRPLPEWGWQAWREGRENNPHEWLGSRTNPGDVDRSMAVDGDTLYVILGWGEPISAVDGATGDVLNTYEETAGTIEFVVHEGVLLVREQNPDPAIKAVNPGDGEVLWRTEASLIADRSLCAAAERVFFSTRSEMVALALDTGDELWRTETGIRPSGVMANEEALLAVVSDVTLALSAETGEVLWEGPGAGTRGRNLDLFLIGDLAWWHRHNAHARRLDDGEEVRRLHLQSLLESGHHRRCYTDRATVNYLITGERGSEFMHLADENHMRHNWTRGPCISGMTPANGLFYVPPHQCFCYSAVRLDGFFALASRADSPGIDAGGGERLERGPAYGEALAESESDGEQWPTYRQNAERSGSVASDVPSELAQAWSTQLGGDLTQAVAAGGRVYVAEKKAGTLHCLDMENGVRLWSRTVAGAIDSPPSVHNGH
ncbi:MAG: PQQ-binding-like beta-propeller repeat protein, partial [Candidatus Hydrogenedentota bacterium]